MWWLSHMSPPHLCAAVQHRLVWTVRRDPGSGVCFVGEDSERILAVEVTPRAIDLKHATSPLKTKKV